jgi:hypothetical protein
MDSIFITMGLVTEVVILAQRSGSVMHVRGRSIRICEMESETAVGKLNGKAVRRRAQTRI